MVCCISKQKTNNSNNNKKSFTVTHLTDKPHAFLRMMPCLKIFTAQVLTQNTLHHVLLIWSPTQIIRSSLISINIIHKASVDFIRGKLSPLPCGAMKLDWISNNNNKNNKKTSQKPPLCLQNSLVYLNNQSCMTSKVKNKNKSWITHQGNCCRNSQIPGERYFSIRSRT